MNIHVAYQRNAWTAEQQTTALQMRAQGAGNGEIARAIGKNRDAVRHWFINRLKPKNPPRVSVWDGERGQTVIRMWRDGHSAAEIGMKVKASRNAVLGFLRRNGENRNKGCRTAVKRQTDKAPKRKATARFKPASVRNVPKFRAEIFPEPVAVAGDPLLLTLEQIGFAQCRYICEGVGDEARYCGHPVHKSGSWCKGHHRVVFWQDAPKLNASKHSWWGQ